MRLCHGSSNETLSWLIKKLGDSLTRDRAHLFLFIAPTHPSRPTINRNTPDPIIIVAGTSISVESASSGILPYLPRITEPIVISVREHS